MTTGQNRDEQIDLLHPLTTLHWEQCFQWTDKVRPTDCVVLQDRVAVLTWRYDCSDTLYISSTDMQSWTTTTLPYYLMSLTTYQSKFVAVGGCLPSPMTYSDQLFTSDTGQQWQATLPPMPTKRCSTSSVSTMLPELLVVAGGLGGDGWVFNIVEVLLDDNWSTVAPLPTACYRMHSTFHDGNLYFIGGEGQRDAVYACRYSSLISSSGKPLWSQFKAPSNNNVAVFYSSNLAYIDAKSNVRAYSSVTQSWVEATCIGSQNDSYSAYVAAAVLPTGELVYARTGGIFRVKISVSSFNLDRLFIPNVLSRLEAVMRIQILSVVTKMNSQLASTSVVQLLGNSMWLPSRKKAPDKYVMNVMSQWSNIGHHNYPPDMLMNHLPTWRNLLKLLRDINLPELSQQIEIFMKGELKFVEAYRHFINTKDVLELLFLKFLFVGPPHLGKTTLRRRLMGEINDLVSANEAEKSHPSTVTVESGHSVIVRSLTNTTAVVTQAKWFSAQSVIQEAGMLFHNFVEAISAATPNINIAKSAGEPSVAQSTAEIHQTERPPEPGLFHKPISKIKGFEHLQQQSHDQPQDIPDVAAIFKEATRQPEFWSDIKYSFKAYLRMEDTGGQPELMDMLPALTIGPGLYLLFFCYGMKLKSKFIVSFQEATGMTSLPEESSFTLEEILLSALSSISCSSTFHKSIDDKEISSDMRKIMESSRSVAYIVGTHKDKVSQEDITSFDDELQSIIRDTYFFKENVVQRHSEDKLVVSIDNMKGGVEEIDEVRKLLESAMDRHFKKLKIPAVWLLFSLCLRIRDVRTASLQYCLDLSGLFNMTPYETEIALWFLHHHAGVMMYFPNVPGLEDLVIIDIQVVYDSVTCLILRAMCFDKVGLAAAENFRRTGQFDLKDLIKATADVTKDFIPPQKLVVLLKYLHIIARVHITRSSTNSLNVEDKEVYIMPCVLRNADNDRLDTFYNNELRPHFIAPLLIRYKCGFVPIGVFPAMIASLIGNESFQVIEKKMMKNCVQFRYGHLKTLVTFMSRPKFYEVIISELPIIKHDVNQICIEIREEVESTFEKVGSRMNYGYFMDYQFAFECPSHPGRGHLCVCSRRENEPKLMMCLQDITNQLPVVLKDCHKIWFYRVMESTITPVGIFKKLYPELVAAVSACVQFMAAHCYSKGLISKEVNELILERPDLTSSNKAGILLSKIEDSITQNPERLDCFIAALHETGHCDIIVQKLQTASTSSESPSESSS